MSLINDALKKAQNQRAAETSAASEAAASSDLGAPRKSPAGFYVVVMLVAGAAVLVGTTILATAYALKSPARTAVLADPAERTRLETKPAPARLVPVATAPERETPALRLTAPAGAASSQGPAALPSSAAAKEAEPKAMTPIGENAAPDTPLLVLPSGLGSQAKTPPDVSKRPNSRAQAFVDAARVIGIRASGQESKVLMNERVYRLNEVVDSALGLRLVEVAKNRLVFEDANGIRYTREF